METVYIETTIVSYLVGRPSRDLLLAAHQELTREWWAGERLRYECVTSAEVLREASLGEAEMVKRRLDALSTLTVLEVSAAALDLTRAILRDRLLPTAAVGDATHVAVGSLHAVDYLLTWNCRHLANPHIQRNLRRFVAQRGLVLPEICTLIELSGQ